LTYESERSIGPKKHPMPKIASSVPSGNGGPMGVPRTRRRPGVTIGVLRPGRVSPGAGKAVGSRVNSIA